MVEREEVYVPEARGSAVVTRIYRGPNGKWAVEFDINFAIEVGDGRQVFVRRYVNIGANEQRGRKPIRPCLDPMAMLPNDRHPGPGCSCGRCLREWPDTEDKSQAVSGDLC
jgi:hypothetical protein